MKHRNILIAIALLLTSCEGFKDTDPAFFSAPEVTVGKAVVSDISIAVELSGAISSIDGKAVKECGFYVSKDAGLASKTTIATTVKEQFSASFTSEEFGTKYYYQAFASNGKYAINSQTLSFEIKPFEYYVSVGKPELVGTERTVAKLKASIQWAVGLNLDEIGFQYSRNKDFSSTSEASQTTGLDTITQDIELDPGVEYHIRVYAKKGSNVEYGEAISVTVYCLPEVTTSSTVTGITPTSATCGGEVTSDGGAQVTEYGVVYGTSQNPTIETATKKAVGKGTESFSATLTGLTTGSTYYVRAYATNSQGTAYGEEVSFTTAKSVTGISLDKTSISLEKGASQTLIATITPSDAYDKAVSWSTSNSNIATVSNGKVTAIATGTATITATSHDGGFKANCTVTVTNSVTGVSLNKTSLTLTQGASETLIAIITPSNATNKAVTWSSSNTSVATVSSTGVVTAKAVGSTSITVTTSDGGKKASCAVTVKAQTISVTGVSLNKTSLSMTVGDKQTLTATISPSTATNKAVTWSSSNTSVATVSSTGVVTAKAAGSTTITVTTSDGGKKAACAVTVKSNTVPVTSVALNKTSLTLTQGSSETLTAHIYPSNATNKNVIWSSSNSSVATVDINGTVKAIAAGYATITATTQDGYFKATCSVNVKGNIVPVTGIALNKSSLILTQGSSETLTATIYPSNATNKSVTWSSSNTSVATVSTSGVVTAKAAGSTTITVTTQDGGYKATCTVTVSTQTISVTGVSLDKTSLSMTVGDTQTLTATITPSNATNKSVTWTSSNTNVAKVSNSGEVTGIASGTATITVTTQDGGYTANCIISITEEAFDHAYITFETISGENKITYSLGPFYEYSYDGNNWDIWKAGYYLQFSQSQKLYVRGDNPNGISGRLDNASHFSFSNSSSVKCSGNIMSLLSYKENIQRVPSHCFKQLFHNCPQLIKAPDLPATNVGSYGYEYMFYGCTSLVSAPELPATKLGAHCYEHMFCGCSSLKSAPTLPAIALAELCYWGMFMDCKSLVVAPTISAQTLAEGCCQEMFYGCTSLISAPALPAIDLSMSCYKTMFFGCTSLVNAPKLPATVLAPACYSGMFMNCTSLNSAPNLPATSLTSGCYASMFSGCTSLQTAPVLPAIILPSNCYFGMFRDCSQLTFVKALFTSIGSESILFWLTNVNPTGTFVKNINAEWSDYGRIPEGWTIEYADE